MKSNLAISLKMVLVYEGGYINHPRDPGGATNFGITQRVYNAYTGSNKSVREITKAEVSDIYKRQYWDAVKGDDLPSGLDFAMFDFAVNSGPSRAITFLQRILGVADDGHIGAITMRAISQADTSDLIVKLCNARMAWLKTLSNYDVFGVGWKRRVVGREPGVQTGDTGVIDYAVKMAHGAKPSGPTKAAQGRPAEPKDQPWWLVLILKLLGMMK